MINYHSLIEERINSGINVIEVVSTEWKRLYETLATVSENLGKEIILFSPISGFKLFGKLDFTTVYDDVSVSNYQDVFKFYIERLKNSILVLEDPETFISSKMSANICYLKQIVRDSNPRNNTLVILSKEEYVPTILSKDIDLLNVPLIGREEIKDQFNRILKGLDKIVSKKTIRYSNSLGEAFLGLDENEMERIIRKVLLKEGKLTDEEIPIVIKEKEQTITNNSLLEVISNDKTIWDVGGLTSLKNWIGERKAAFSMEANKFGLHMPKGILLLGVPGCGKSLIAKAVASSWNYPLLKLDFGKLYNRYLGESEANLREAIHVAEAMSPCILWADEIEKGIAGAGRSDDNGVASRLFGAFLTWMQEKKKPVFIVATANHVSQIPTELFRKGRFDEIFFLDLPNLSERESIFKIHLNKTNQDLRKIDIKHLAEISEGFSGAEIEGTINDAMFTAYNGIKRLTQEILVDAINETRPLSKSMQDSVSDIRNFAQSIKQAR